VDLLDRIVEPWNIGGVEHTSSLSPAEIALLGLLAEGPRHPWELSKQVEYRSMRDWTELSQSTIYKQLRALQARGLVEVTDVVVTGRIRHQYRISESGRRAAAEGVLDLLSHPTYPRWPVDIATYNIDLVDRRVAITALGRYAEELRARADGWARLVVFLQDEGCPPHRWALADRARHMIDGELRWIAELTAQLAQDAPAEPTGTDAEAAGSEAAG
jgi:DNA-binding PadR family transcriptional regulator